MLLANPARIIFDTLFFDHFYYTQASLYVAMRELLLSEYILSQVGLWTCRSYYLVRVPRYVCLCCKIRASSLILKLCLFLCSISVLLRVLSKRTISRKAFLSFSVLSFTETVHKPDLKRHPACGTCNFVWRNSFQLEIFVHGIFLWNDSPNNHKQYPSIVLLCLHLSLKVICMKWIEGDSAVKIRVDNRFLSSSMSDIRLNNYSLYLA